MPGYEQTTETFMLPYVNSIGKWTGMKNTGFKTPEKYQIYVKSDFHTMTELKFYVRVLVFSVFNVMSYIHGLPR